MQNHFDRTVFEWRILDSLANDYESPQIIFKEIKSKYQSLNWEAFLDALFPMYERGLITNKDQATITQQRLKDELETGDSSIWLGMSEVGAKLWEDGARALWNDPVDWSKTWVCRIDYVASIGFIEGLDPKVCLEVLKKIDIDEGWQIEVDSVTCEKIPGFQKNYYKYLSNAVKLSFGIKKLN